MVRKLLGNKTIKNAGWLIGGKVAQMLINLVVGLLTARYLGPSNFGTINYAAAYVAFFSAFCTLGINSVLVKEFVQRPGQEGTILGTSIFLRAVSSLLSALTIICVVALIDAGESVTIAVVALSTIGMVFHVLEVFHYWFQSRLQSKVTAIVSLVAYTAAAAYRVVLLVMGKSVVWFAFATSVDYICVGILLLLSYKKHGGGKLRVSMAYGKELLKISCYFILPSLMVAVYSQTDKIMLKQMISNAEIGYYATAVSLSTVWCFVLQAIIDSVYPSIMHAFGKDEAVFQKRNKQLYAIVFYLSLTVSLGITLLAKPIVYLLYGKEFLPAVAPLRIITWYTAFSYLGVARNPWIVCKNKQKYMLHIYTTSALANVVLNLIFIPMWGACGAAVASLTAQVLTTMVVPFFIKPLRENSKMMVQAICFRGIF